MKLRYPIGIFYPRPHHWIDSKPDIKYIVIKKKKKNLLATFKKLDMV